MLVRVHVLKFNTKEGKELSGGKEGGISYLVGQPCRSTDRVPGNGRLLSGSATSIFDEI